MERNMEREAFVLGWHVGSLYGETSAREAEKYLPERATTAMIDCFCEGSIDGAVGDRFRLDQQAEDHSRPRFKHAAGLAGGLGAFCEHCGWNFQAHVAGGIEAPCPNSRGGI